MGNFSNIFRKNKCVTKSSCHFVVTVGGLTPFCGTQTLQMFFLLDFAYLSSLSVILDTADSYLLLQN
jgi:hypothetical protein